MKIKLMPVAYFLALTLLVVIVNFGVSGVSVTQADNDGKTTICHSTGSATNPFVVITISNNAVAQHLENHPGDFIINNDADLARCLGGATATPAATHTSTPRPPTATPVPPTATPRPPTATPHL